MKYHLWLSEVGAATRFYLRHALWTPLVQLAKGESGIERFFGLWFLASLALIATGLIRREAADPSSWPGSRLAIIGMGMWAVEFLKCLWQEHRRVAVAHDRAIDENLHIVSEFLSAKGEPGAAVLGYDLYPQPISNAMGEVYEGEWALHLSISVINRTPKPMDLFFRLTLPSREGQKTYAFAQIMYSDRGGDGEWLRGGLRVPAFTVRNYRAHTNNVGDLDFDCNSAVLLVKDLMAGDQELRVKIPGEVDLGPG